MKSVNPEKIAKGDIISTRNGVARVGWVNEEKGYLSYSPVDDPGMYACEIPIRSVSLLAKEGNKEQLSFSFIQEMIEEAITARNRELERTKEEAIQRQVAKTQRARRKRPLVTEEEKEIAKLLSKLSPSDLNKLLED